MTRAEFKAAVFGRDNSQCVFCGKPAVDAHHIMDRKLWPDGGYYLDNGASVCEECHWQCEKSIILPHEVRKAAGINVVLLPPKLSHDKLYDKWGDTHCRNCGGDGVVWDEDGIENLCTDCGGMGEMNIA